MVKCSLLYPQSALPLSKQTESKTGHVRKTTEHREVTTLVFTVILTALEATMVVVVQGNVLMGSLLFTDMFTCLKKYIHLHLFQICYDYNPETRILFKSSFSFLANLRHHTDLCSTEGSVGFVSLILYSCGWIRRHTFQRPKHKYAD